MLSWVDENNGSVGGIPFRVVNSGFNESRTTDKEIVILKGKSFFDHYQRLFPNAPERILELGIFEGGSAIVFGAMWPHTTIKAIDLRQSSAAVLRHIDQFGMAGRVQLHYGVGQDDDTRVSEVLDEFDAPCDLVIDDASHQYPLSRKSFEIIFPRLAAGGIYIIEDWAWAHWKEWKQFVHFAKRPALSNLVWELTMATATSPEFIESVTSNSRMAIVQKNRKCGKLPPGFSVSNIYTARGKNLEQLL